jgi:hypothetical protein
VSLVLCPGEDADHGRWLLESTRHNSFPVVRDRARDWTLVPRRCRDCHGVSRVASLRCVASRCVAAVHGRYCGVAASRCLEVLATLHSKVDGTALKRWLRCVELLCWHCVAIAKCCIDPRGQTSAVARNAASTRIDSRLGERLLPSRGGPHRAPRAATHCVCGNSKCLLTFPDLCSEPPAP